jgi:tetratricopeptide (TPR) repeat protein
MARIYISSTFEDLKEHRAAVYRTLRRMRHDVISMEDYVAGDQRPLDKCLDDVAHSDLYIAILAWRYGFIPPNDNPLEKSITELEYRQAGQVAIPRLVFILDAHHHWPPEFRDEKTGEGDAGRRIIEFRRHAEKEHVRALFTTPESLSVEVSLAVPHVVAGLGHAALFHQLPPDIGDFTGRTAVLGSICDLLRRTDGDQPPTSVIICAISGKGGVGKTTLAIRAANEVRDLFPEQLYMDLRGLEAEPRDPADVLAEFLRTMGVKGAAIPRTLDDRSRHYREELARRRALVLLDNAANERQVLPLLPGKETSAALVTSRVRLALDGAHQVNLDVLEPSESLQLLGRLAGPQRLHADPLSARRIVDMCGHLPLAVRIAGSKLAARSHWRLSTFAERLKDERRRLGELQIGDREVRATFALSYVGRGQEERMTFRLLSSLKFPDFPAWIAAALLDQPLDRTEDVVERLVDAQLLEVSAEDGSGQIRYRFHDLLRVFAREELEREELAATTHESIDRVVGGYLTLVERAGMRLFPRGRRDVSETRARRWSADGIAVVVASVDRDPIAWFKAERTNLVQAVEHGFNGELWELTWELADKLSGFFRVLDYWGDWQHTHRLGLEAALRAGNRRGEAWILRNLGNASRDENRFAEAEEYFKRALVSFRGIGNRLGEAATLNGLGDVCLDQSRYDEALAYFDVCLPLFRELGDDLAEAYTLNSIGHAYREQGRLDQSDALLERARAAFRTLSDSVGEAWNLLNMSDLRRLQRRLPEAKAFLNDAMSILERFDDRIGEAWGSRSAGLLHHTEGRLAEARIDFESALERFRELGGRRGEGHTLLSLSALSLDEGRADEALASLEVCLPIFRQLGDRLREARALATKARALRVAGDTAAANVALDEAVSVAAHLGVDVIDELQEGTIS